MARKQFYINGTASGTFNIFVSNDTYLNAPQIDYTEYSVPARNGSLIAYNKRLNNVIRKFDCYIKTDVNDSLDALKKLIYSNPGYLTISSDYDPGTYQLGYLAQEIEVEPFNEEGSFSVQFSLYFSCQPQKFYVNNQSESGNPNFTRWLDNIADRSYIGVSQSLNNIPIDSLPEADAFYIFRIYSASSSATATETITVTTAAPFVAIYSGYIDNISQYGNDYFNELLAYSSTGSISWTGTFTGRVYAIIPIDYVGTVVASAGNYSLNTSVAPLFSAENSNALGVSIGLDVEYTYTTGSTNDPSYIYIKGSINSKKTFDSIICVDFTKLAEVYSITSRSYLEIDADTLDARMFINGEYYKTNEYVTINGELSGMADKVEVTAYKISSTTYSPNRITILPRWYKL